MPEAAVILVVEDREDDFLVLRHAFRAAGILNPVVWVQSGEEAITYLRGSAPYSNRKEFPLPLLILLDLKMPGLDGFDIIRYIRARLEFSSIAVIVLTSSTDVKDVQRAYDLGASSFIVKETEFQDMVTLSKALKDYWLRVNRAVEAQRPRQESGGSDVRA